MDSPLTFLYGKRISSVQSILPILEQVAKVNKPLLVMAEDIDGEALAMLIVNKLRGGFKVGTVMAPGFGDDRKAMMQDLAVLTGTTLFSDGFGDKLEDVQITQLGSAKTVTFTKDHIVLLSAAGDKHAIEERCGSIRVIIDHSTSEYEMDSPAALQ
jgi:chaperonin GroEL